MSKKAVIYACVSSGGDQQVADLQSYAAGVGLEVVLVFTEQVSGAQQDRPILAECLDWCCTNDADVLLVPEISHLGRTANFVAESVDRLTKAGVNIHIQDIDIDTLLPSGEGNPLAATLVAMLGLGAKMERALIMGRLNGGRQRAIENGVPMGRKFGSVKTRAQKEKEYAKVIKLLKKGTTIRNTAKLCGVSPNTVQTIKNEFIKKH